MGSHSKHHRMYPLYSLCLLTLAGGLLLGAFLSKRRPASPQESGIGRLKVVMGKTPLPSQPVKAAAVTITRVEVWRSRPLSERAAMGAAMHGLGPGDSSEGSWVTVYQGQQILNLLELRNGQANLLINADVPEGHYTHLRLACGQGRITIGEPQGDSADRTFVVEPRREVASDVALDCEFTVAAGRETSLLLNVDVDRAFLPVSTDKSQDLNEVKGFQFRPASAMRLANLLSAGPANNSTPPQDQVIRP
jgi:hypothetical protein